MEKKNRKWVYVILGMIINMCLGTVYSYSVLKIPLKEYFEIGIDKVGFPYMIFLACFAFSMPIGGIIIEKFSEKMALLIGGIMVGVGWFLSGYAGSITQITIFYGVVAGVGVGIAYGAPLAIVSKWFTKKKGLALGLTLGGFGLSPFITAPLLSKLIEKYQIMSTFKIMGVSFLIIIIFLSLFMKTKKENDIDETVDENLKENSLESKEILKKKEFYGLYICYVIATLAGLTAIGISSLVAVDTIKINKELSAILISVFAIFNGIGRPIFGSLVDRFGVKKSVYLSYIMILVASFLMIFAKENTIIIYVISFSIFWLNLGGFLAIAPAATIKFFGTLHYSKNYGIMYTAYGVGALLGVFFSGKIKVIFGNYQYFYYSVIVLVILGSLIAKISFKDEINE
jgi:MFS family permease